MFMVSDSHTHGIKWNATIVRFPGCNTVPCSDVTLEVITCRIISFSSVCSDVRGTLEQTCEPAWCNNLEDYQLNSTCHKILRTCTAFHCCQKFFTPENCNIITSAFFIWLILPHHHTKRISISFTFLTIKIMFMMIHLVLCTLLCYIRLKRHTCLLSA